MRIEEREPSEEFSLSMSESDFANFRSGSENVEALNMAKDGNVVIPSSPQVALEKKEKTPEVSCVGKVGIFFCLSASLLSLMGCVVYIGFWVHYNAEGETLNMISFLMSRE